MRIGGVWRIILVFGTFIHSSASSFMFARGRLALRIPLARGVPCKPKMWETYGQAIHVVLQQGYGGGVTIWLSLCQRVLGVLPIK